MNTKTVTLLCHKSRLLNAAALLAFVHVGAAQAQLIDKVEISMADPCNINAPNRITVALTIEKKTLLFPAKREDSSLPWTGDIPVGGVSIKRSSVSLRFEGTRTDCQMAVRRKNNGVGVFRFSCNQQTVRDVTISTDSGIKAHCVRNTLDCGEETEDFTSGGKPYPISLWVPGEELSIQLGWNMPKPPEPLLVFSRDAGAADWPVFAIDPEISAFLVFNDNEGKRHKQKAAELVFLKQDIASLIMSQHFRKFTKIEVAANDHNYTRFEKAGLKRLTLSVK